jgi:hypothetical protein
MVASVSGIREGSAWRGQGRPVKRLERGRWTASRFGASFTAEIGGSPMARFGTARLGALALLALAACKPAEAPQLDPGAEVIARQFYEEVKSGADLNANTHLAHELKNPTSEQQLAMFRSMIPDEPSRSIDLEAWDAKTTPDGTTTRLTIDYGYSDRILVAQTALFKSPGGKDPVIVGFQVTTKPPGG